MKNDIKEILSRLNMPANGRYENHFYVIDLPDSDEYGRAYTKLVKVAIDTEYPSFGKNSSNNTTKVTNYFEIDVNSITYPIFLVADFDTDTYRIKIGGQ